MSKKERWNDVNVVRSATTPIPIEKYEVLKNEVKSTGKVIHSNSMVPTLPLNVVLCHQCGSKENSLWQRQERINVINSRFNTINYVFNCRNLMNAGKLAQKYQLLRVDLERGKELILKHAESLKMMTNHLEGMDEKLRNHCDVVVSLRSSVYHQYDQINVWMKQLKNQVNDQNGKIQSQEKVLQALSKGRFKNDMLVDVITFVLGMMIYKNPFFQWIKNIMSSQTSSLLFSKALLHKHHKKIDSALNFLFFLSIHHVLRVWTMQHGIHHAVGTYSKYILFLLQKIIKTNTIK